MNSKNSNTTMILISFLRLFLLYIPHVVATAADTPTVYIIRHAEKPDDPEDEGLTADGFRRAECLRHVFGAASPYNIGYIIAERPNKKGRHRRSFQTVLPLAQDLNLTVDISCKRNQVECVGNLVRDFPGRGNILIAWRHGKMKEIVEELGSDNPPEYPEDRFDLIWTDPFPYENITDIRSEGCPSLDAAPSLRIQT